MKPTAFLKVARTLWHTRFEGDRIPLFIGYAVTNRCNQACRYCDKQLLATTELTTAESLAMIDELAELGARVMTLTGGEPLLREDLGDLLERCAHHGITVTLNTNGMLLSQRRNLLPLIDTVTLSLDGGIESNRVRGTDTYDVVLAAARLVAAAGRGLAFTTVIHANNVSQLHEILEIAKSFSATATFQPISFYYNGARMVPPELIPPPQTMREAIKSLLAAKHLYRYLGNSVSGLNYLSQWPFPAPIPCRVWRSFCRIEPDGVLYSCARQFARAEKFAIRTYGVEEAFRRVARPLCEGCWCGAMLELNLLLGFDRHALTHAFNRLR